MGSGLKKHILLDRHVKPGHDFFKAPVEGSRSNFDYSVAYRFQELFLSVSSTEYIRTPAGISFTVIQAKASFPLMSRDETKRRIVTSDIPCFVPLCHPASAAHFQALAICSTTPRCSPRVKPLATDLSPTLALPIFRF